MEPPAAEPAVRPDGGLRGPVASPGGVSLRPQGALTTVCFNETPPGHERPESLSAALLMRQRPGREPVPPGHGVSRTSHARVAPGKAVCFAPRGGEMGPVSATSVPRVRPSPSHKTHQTFCLLGEGTVRKDGKSLTS